MDRAANRAAEEFDLWRTGCKRTTNPPEMVNDSLMALVHRHGTTLLTIHCLGILTDNESFDNGGADDKHPTLMAIVDVCALLILSTRFFDAALECLLSALIHPRVVEIRNVATTALVAASAAASKGQGPLANRMYADKVHNKITNIITGRAGRSAIEHS
jgi:hypothetical protein